MLRGLYTAGVGMTTQMKRMDVVSNNIANINTTGFKKDTAVTSAFEDVLAKRTHDIEDKKFPPFARKVGDITYGAFIDEVYTDFSQGSLRTTHGTYDLAIAGDGFFVVNTTAANGTETERYTRDGSFTVDANGILVTKDGGRVQGENGSIEIPNGTVVVEANGGVFVDGELIDRIKMTDFEDKTKLRKYGDNYLTKTDDAAEIPFTGTVIQGSLEASNVNSVKEMVDLITVNRTYEANQRIIQAIDTTLQRSAQDVGRK